MLLKDLRPEHLDQFDRYLKKAVWHRNLPIGTQEIKEYPLSVRRQNMAKMRFKQALKLAYQRKYIDEDLSFWVAFQREELPEIDPLSIEEQSTFLRVVPQRWGGVVYGRLRDGYAAERASGLGVGRHRLPAQPDLYPASIRARTAQDPQDSSQ
jgi:hypothetical protein